jgi:hypothetical protein
LGWICGYCRGKSEVIGYIKREEKTFTIFRKCQKCGKIVASHNLKISKWGGTVRGENLAEIEPFKSFVDWKELLTFVG